MGWGWGGKGRGGGRAEVEGDVVRTEYYADVYQSTRCL